LQWVIFITSMILISPHTHITDLSIFIPLAIILTYKTNGNHGLTKIETTLIYLTFIIIYIFYDWAILGTIIIIVYVLLLFSITAFYILKNKKFNISIPC
jgi:hypothetical protein